VGSQDTTGLMTSQEFDGCCVISPIVDGATNQVVTASVWDNKS
jgi:aconitase B